MTVNEQEDNLGSIDVHHRIGAVYGEIPDLREPFVHRHTARLTKATRAPRVNGTSSEADAAARGEHRGCYQRQRPQGTKENSSTASAKLFFFF